MSRKKAFIVGCPERDACGIGRYPSLMRRMLLV